MFLSFSHALISEAYYFLFLVYVLHNIAYHVIAWLVDINLYSAFPLIIVFLINIYCSCPMRTMKSGIPIFLHTFHSVTQFNTMEGRSVINKADLGSFLVFSGFLNYPVFVSSNVLCPSAFLKAIWTSGITLSIQGSNMHWMIVLFCWHVH